MSMRILLFTMEFPPCIGGAGIYTADLAEALAKQGVSATVLAPIYNANEKDWDNQQPYTIIRGFKLDRNIINIIKQCYVLIKQIMMIKPHIVHVTNSDAHKRAALVFLLLPCKFVLTIHGSEVYSFFDKNKQGIIQKAKSYILKSYFTKALNIICVSYSTKNLLLKFINRNYQDVKVIYNGINLKKFKMPSEKKIREVKAKYKLNGHILLSVSRLEHDKGNDSVIKALPEVLEYYPDLQYIIVGDGPFKTDLKKMVDRLNLTEHVIFTGKIDPHEVYLFYSASDIFILPSKRGKRESFGLVYVEAYRYKLPVVGSTHGGVPEVVIDGLTGYTIDPFNIREITKSILKLLASSEKAEKMGEEGYKLCINEFNSERMAMETKDLYKKILNI